MWIIIIRQCCRYLCPSGVPSLQLMEPQFQIYASSSQNVCWSCRWSRCIFKSKWYYPPGKGGLERNLCSNSILHYLNRLWLFWKFEGLTWCAAILPFDAQSPFFGCELVSLVTVWDNVAIVHQDKAVSSLAWLTRDSNSKWWRHWLRILVCCRLGIPSCRGGCQVRGWS